MFSGGSWLEAVSEAAGGEGKVGYRLPPRWQRLCDSPSPRLELPPLLSQRPYGQVHTSPLALIISLLLLCQLDWDSPRAGAVGQASLYL